MNQRLILALTGLGALSLAACGGDANSSSSGAFSIVEVSNGFGKLLPYRIEKLDPATGFGDGTTIEINSFSDITDNLTPLNMIEPPVKWQKGAVLPNNAAGNHFLYVRFNQSIDIASVLTPAVTAKGDNNLVGNIQVVQVEINENGTTVTPLDGIGFVGGRTYGGTPDVNGQLPEQTWVGLADSKPFATNVGGAFPGIGFPGTETNYNGANQLVASDVFVFVVDTDDNLLTHETFPEGVHIQMKITTGTLNTRGRTLTEQGVASSTVGDDLIAPEVLVAGAAQTPVIIPSDLEQQVDPETNIEITFTEPIQFLTVGSLDDGTPPALSFAVQLQFGPSTAKVQVPFTVMPASIYDLTHLVLTPTYHFPGAGANTTAVSCADFSVVDVLVNAATFLDLNGNVNGKAQSTMFFTDVGPGLVNAPVLPDALYVGRGGSNGGISIVDLNGFGQGPGPHEYDLADPIKQGNTNLLNDPNFALQGSFLVPPLTQGSCTVNGGSSGVFTLSVDSSLDDLLVRAPLIETVGDMAIGHGLDNSFNNASPFGCQSGGGNICVTSGFKVVTIATGGSTTLVPGTLNAQVFPLKTEFGVENLVSWSPHPNPPPLIFPPLCLSPLIGAQEPTSVESTIAGFSNLLVPSTNALGIPSIKQAPQGIISTEQNAFFQGPSPPQASILSCQQFMMRQQIGNFLYVVDRARGEVVVFNSNRMTVLDRIVLPDPTSLAMSPNLDFIAVTNERADQVSIIDTNPASPEFHRVVRTTVVGRGPTGIAWTPDNEDILVCNTGDNTMSIISAYNFDQRKVVRNQLRGPMEVVITPRQNGFALLRQVYFAYILNSDGSVAIFESGPDGINGWGFDDVIGIVPFTFDNPKTIVADPTRISSYFWVAHENRKSILTGENDGDVGGALTNCGMSSGNLGRVPLEAGSFANPRLRDIQFKIFASVGSTQLTGVPVDIAFDNLKNRTALTNISNPFSASTPLSINGKSIIKAGGTTCLSPQFIFLAVPSSIEGSGVIDVLRVDGGLIRQDTNPFIPGIQSIPAPNANVVVDFLRQ